MALRMLSASREIAAAMPPGFFAPTALDVLLVLHVAEDEASYLSIGELQLPGSPSTIVTQRWLKALMTEGLVDRRGQLIALSQKGYALVTTIIESIYVAQRGLD